MVDDIPYLSWSCRLKSSAQIELNPLVPEVLTHELFESLRSGWSRLIWTMLQPVIMCKVSNFGIVKYPISD